MRAWRSGPQDLSSATADADAPRSICDCAAHTKAISYGLIYGLGCVPSDPTQRRSTIAAAANIARLPSGCTRVERLAASLAVSVSQAKQLKTSFLSAARASNDPLVVIPRPV